MLLLLLQAETGWEDCKGRLQAAMQQLDAATEQMAGHEAAARAQQQDLEGQLLQAQVCAA